MQIADSYGVCRQHLKNPRCERRVSRWLTEILSSQQKHREKGKAKFGEEGNARGRGERRNEKLRRTIKRKRKRTTVACRRKREEMTERKSGRLWEDQSARGEEAAGPRTACVPEKVQCPPSEA